MATIKFTAPAAAVTLLTSTALASGDLSAASSEFDNSTTRATHAFLEFQADFASSGPNLGDALDLYLLPAFDGTNYTDTAKHPNCHLISLSVQNSGSSQRIAPDAPVEIPPFKFKVALYNGTGVTLDTYTVRIRTTSKEVA